MRYGRAMDARRSAGSLLREARTRAGLSQAELAKRAGMSQSVISAYEAGRRQPALPTLAALVEASGHHLDVKVLRDASPLAGLRGPVGRRVRRHRARLVRIAAAHRVVSLRVFGSVARGDDRADSDLDLLVDVPPGVGLLGLGRLQQELEDLVQAHVDLVPSDSLKPQLRATIDSEVIPL